MFFYITSQSKPTCLIDLGIPRRALQRRLSATPLNQNPFFSVGLCSLRNRRLQLPSRCGFACEGDAFSTSAFLSCLFGLLGCLCCPGLPWAAGAVLGLCAAPGHLGCLGCLDYCWLPGLLGLLRLPGPSGLLWTGLGCPELS